MKDVLITWGFDSFTGNLYLDCYAEVMRGDDANTVPLIFKRANIQGTHPAYLSIPDEEDREYIENYFQIPEARESLIKLLKKAKVSQNQIVKKRTSDSNTVEFLLED
jgi:hypothetical protein